MRKFLSITLIMVLVISLVACGTEKPPVEQPNTTEPTVETTPTEEVTPTEPTEVIPPVETAKNKNNMSAAILDLAYTESQNNTMFSPLSMDMAMAMVSEGAGANKALFNEFLGKDDYAEYAKTYFSYLESLNRESTFSYGGYETVFEIANSLWLNKDYNLQNKYTEKVMNYYAELDNLDFIDRATAVKKINDWANEKTHEMIPQLLSESDLTEYTKMVVVNAVYFESPWTEPWLVSSNTSTFKKFDESELQLNMLKTTNGLYYENEYATAFGATYRNGLQFIGILPKEKGDFRLQDLDIDSLLASETNKYDVISQMPKFKFDNTIDNLVAHLTELGYGELFAQDLLPEIAQEDGKDVSLFISKIIQADAIELDENGTKAAAATAIILDKNAAFIEPPETKEVILDRPFAFLIYDPQMEQIVFMGKVVDPS